MNLKYCVPVAWMTVWIRIQSEPVVWVEHPGSLSPVELGEQVLLLVEVQRSDEACLAAE